MESLFHLLVLAEAATPAQGPTGQGNPLMTFVPLIFLFVIFYFLLIRPQQKRQKEHQKMVSALKTGDKVVTNGGIHGLIVNVKERTALVKVADNVKIEFDKAAIAIIEKGNETEDNTDPK